jgi:CcmD family protein
MNPYLVAAYVGVWVLHAVYLGTLGSRQKKVQTEIDLLNERAKREKA